MDYARIENVLDVYSLDDIFELNDVTETDVLLFLVRQDFIELPDPEPL